MGQPDFSLAVDFVTDTCINCGIAFGVPREWNNRRRHDHREYYCPNGHRQYYSAESDAEKNARLLREEQERHQRTLARENAERAAKTAAENALKRHKTRTKNGTCPCCKRTFKQLAAHMKTKHPDYK